MGATPTKVAYVAACALGLAFSEHHGEDAVVDLLAAAEGCPATLGAAREALRGYPSEDPAVVRVADDLLLSAEGAARVEAPTAS